MAVSLCCDARRPSLCLEALTSRNELSDVVTDPHSDKRIRGPFAGGATSGKSGFAYEAYEARKWEQDKPATELATCDQVARIIYWAWDHKLCELAIADPSSLAARLCPQSYRTWKAERSALHGQAEQGSAHYSEAYLDDELSFLLGALQAVMFLLIYCL